MQIEEGKVVALEYILKDQDGTLIEQSDPAEPLHYLHGHNNILPALENAVEGEEPGAALEVRLSPEEGYGERQTDLEHKVPRDQFQEVEQLEVGMQFRVKTDQGEFTVQVADIQGDEVTVDGNHPLAGKNLKFDVKVAAVREANSEELAEGRPQDTGDPSN